MRKVILFIAMSLDGYIADEKGGVDWLDGQGDDDENLDTYSEFVKDIDTILMGCKTYEQVINELSPGKWIYSDFTTYVISHREHAQMENVHVTDLAPADLIKQLREKPGKDIWICGGANIVQQLMEEDLIDRYHITVIPTLLGAGIRLFENGRSERKLKLAGTRSYNGMVELVYARR